MTYYCWQPAKGGRVVAMFKYIADLARNGESVSVICSNKKECKRLFAEFLFGVAGAIEFVIDDWENKQINFKRGSVRFFVPDKHTRGRYESAS